MIKINMLVRDRILHIPYPFNYGFIPNTLSEDGDPLDVVVLMNADLIPGTMIRCKIVGYLDTRDDAGNDPKLFVCPILDPLWENIEDLLSVDSVNLNYTEVPFIHVSNFETYKDNSYEYGLLACFSEGSGVNINPVILKRIKYFFEHYKDLENKKVEVGSFYNKGKALKIYQDSIERCKSNTIQKSKITDFFPKV